MVIVLGGEADAAEHLQGALARLAPVAAGECLYDFAKPRRRGTVEPHTLAGHALDGDAVGASPRQQVTDRLELADGLAELLPRGCVLDGEPDGPLGGAKDLEGEGNST